MSERRQCTAKNRAGNRCGRAPIRGGTVCSRHGGGAPAVRAAAERRLQEAEALAVAHRLGVPIDIEPAQALLELVRWTAGEVRYWRTEVDRIAGEDPSKLTASVTRIERGTWKGGIVDMKIVEATPHIAYRMWTDAQDRLARYATAALRAGAQEQQVRVSEELGAVIAGVIQRTLDQLELPPDQAALAGGIVARELRALPAPIEESGDQS